LYALLVTTATSFPFGQDEHVVAAIAGHRPGRLVLALQRVAEAPEEVAVLGVVARLRMRRQGGIDPGLRKDLPALPASAVGDHCTDLRDITAAKARTATAHRDAVRCEVPFHRRDAERLLQHVGREGIEVLAGRALDDRAGNEGARRAIRERAVIRTVLRLRLPRSEALDRQVEREARPVLDHVHALLVAARERVVVVALPQRTHRQQVFQRELLLARIGSLHRLLVGKVGIDLRLHVRDQAAIDRRANQQRGDALGRRAHVVERVAGTAVEIVFVDELAVVDDHDAGDALPGLVGDAALELGEFRRVPAGLARVGDIPAVCRRLRDVIRRGDRVGVGRRCRNDREGGKQAVQDSIAHDELRLKGESRVQPSAR
jgi:hypothetical protein